MSSGPPPDPARPRQAVAYSAVAQYGLAAGLGLALVFWMFPVPLLLGRNQPGWVFSLDHAQQVIGQHYFLHAPWSWHLLRAKRLGAPYGTNIAFTDSVPLLSLVLKLFAPLLPPQFQAITLWQALDWLLQPIAAVFALRGTRERRLLPAVSVAIIASAMPTFLWRLWHAALDSHFLLFIALGLYLRAVRTPGRGGGRSVVALAIGQPLVLLIHPYIMLLWSALFAAVPTTLLLRRDKHWLRPLAALFLGCFTTLLLIKVLGYMQGASPDDFGTYSMNLLAPVWPAGSSLFPGFGFGVVDATGGQGEGYQYLGAGVLMLIAAVALGASGQALRALSRHAGLALVLAVLWALALSNKIYAGHLLIIDLGQTPKWFSAFRASGRLFWPVAQALVVGTIAIVATRFPRGALMLLPVAAILQVADTNTLRKTEQINSMESVPFSVNSAVLARLFSQSSSLSVFPPFPCDMKDIDPMMQLIWLASRYDLQTDTMYTARVLHMPDCDPSSSLARDLLPGEALILLPSARHSINIVPDRVEHCAPLGVVDVCASDEKALDLIRNASSKS